MIEVEKKVCITDKDLKKIEELGVFLETQTLTDTYFDTEDFRYTTNDMWIRERDCKFELKIAIKGLKGQIDHYEELREEKAILSKLGLEREKDLSKAFVKAKIFPYATFQTLRRKYQINEFIVDLDMAYFDDFIYRIAEVEILVSDESKVPQAEKKLEAFMEKIGLDTSKSIKPKLIEFLSHKNPTHYQALIASGIVK